MGVHAKGLWNANRGALHNKPEEKWDSPNPPEQAGKHRVGGKVLGGTSPASVVSATPAHCQQVNKPDPKLRVELTAVLPLSWWRSLGRVILNVGDSYPE
jgi:hypothetical protein